MSFSVTAFSAMLRRKVILIWEKTPRAPASPQWGMTPASDGSAGDDEKLPSTCPLSNTGLNCEAPFTRASSAKTRGFHTQLDEGPETP